MAVGIPVVGWVFLAEGPRVGAPQRGELDAAHGRIIDERRIAKPLFIGRIRDIASLDQY